MAPGPSSERWSLWQAGLLVDMSQQPDARGRELVAVGGDTCKARPGPRQQGGDSGLRGMVPTRRRWQCEPSSSFSQG